jgi:hypothetical protein
MSRNRVWKILATGLLALSVVFLLLNFVVESYLYDKIQKTEGIYAAEIDCSIFGNSYSLIDVKIDSSAHLPFEATCKEINIKGFRRLKYLLRDELKFSEIIFETAELFVHQKLVSNTPDISPKNKIYDISIDDIICRDGRVHYLKEGVEWMDAQEVHFRVLGLVLNDSDSITYKDLAAHSGSIMISPPGMHHQMDIASAEYDPLMGYIKLLTCRYYSRISKAKWYHTLQEKQTRIDWQADKIEIFGPNLLAAINHGDFIAQRVIIEDSKLDAFEDQRFTHCDACNKMLPHQMLQLAGNKIHVDSVLVLRGMINYTSFEKGQNALAAIRFDHVYGALYGMTNIPSEIKNQSKMLLDVQANLFEDTPIKLHFQFDLRSRDGAYTYYGQAHPFPLTRLNNYFEHAKHVRISEGVSGGIKFKIEANENLAHGLMNFPYRELKVDFLKKDKTKSKLLSKLLNGLVVHRHNIKSDQYRQGIVYHQVDTSRSIFHSLSQSLQTGIQSSTLKNYALPEELRD